QLRYAACDAAILLPLYDVLAAALEADGLLATAALEHQALPAMVWLESSGLPIDEAAWNALGVDAAAEVADLDARLAVALPNVHLGSPQQVIAAFAERGIDLDDTQNATLKDNAERHPAIDLVRRRRHAGKRASTYGVKYLKEHVDPTDGRIHADYFQ